MADPNPFDAVDTGTQIQTQAPAANPFDQIAQPQAQANPFDQIPQAQPKVNLFNFMRPAPAEEQEVQNAQAGYGVLPEVQAPTVDPHMTNALDKSLNVGLYNKQITEPTDQQDMADHPVVSALGSGMGSLIKYGGLGAALAPAMGASVATAIAGEGGISLMPWIQGAANVGLGAQTFGTAATLDAMSKLLQGGQLTTKDFTNIPGQTAAGALFGGIQAIPNAAIRITAQGFYGAGLSKLEGGNDVQSVVNGFVMSLFGLASRVDLNDQFRYEAADKVKETLATKLNEFGMPQEQADGVADHLTAGFKLDPKGTANEGLTKATLDYFQDLNDRIKALELTGRKALPGDKWMATNPAVETPLVEKPLAEVVPGSIESLHGEESGSEPIHLDDGVQRQTHLFQIQPALDVYQQAENERIQKLNDSGISVPPVTIPPANALPPTIQQKLVNVVKDEIAKPEGNDESVKKAILKTLGRDENGNLDFKNTIRSISADIMHEGREDAGKTPVDDWHNLGKKQTIDELGYALKAENVERKAQRLPVIVPDKDIVVHRATYPGQEVDLKAIRDAISRAYNRATVSEKPVKPPEPNPFDAINPYVPTNVPERTKMLTDMFKASRAKGLPFGVPVEPQPATPAQVPTVEQAVQKQIEGLPKHESSIDKALIEYKIAAKNLRRAVRQDDYKIPEAREKQQEAEVELRGALEQSNISKELYDKIWDSRNETQTELEENAWKSSKPEQGKIIEWGMHEPAPKPEAKKFQILTNEQMENWRQLREASKPVTWESLTDDELQHVVVQMEAHRVQQSHELRTIVQPASPEVESIFQKAGQVAEPPEPSVAEDKARMLHEKLTGILLHLEDWSQGFLSTERWIEGERAKGVSQERKIQASGEVAGVKNRNLYKEDTYKEDFGVEEDPFAQKETPEEKKRRAELLTKDAEKLYKARGFLGQAYLPEIMKLAEGTGDAINAVNGLGNWATKRDIERAIGSIKNKLSEIELGVQDIKGIVDGYPESLSDDPEKHASNNKLEKDDTDYEQDQGLNDRGTAMSPAEWLAVKKIYKWGPEEQVCALPTVMAMMRKYPWMANLQDYFAFKMGGEPMKEQLQLAAKERFTAAGAKGAVYDYAQYENALTGIVRKNLQTQFDSQVDAIKEKMKELKIKGGTDALRQRILQTNELMDDAAELWIAQDPQNGTKSLLASNAHKPGEEVDYVRKMIETAKKWNIPYTQADITRWQMSRTSDLWDWLAHPNVINGNILQRIIAFNKAAIINPLFKTSLDQGKFANTNVLQQVADGYQPHHAVLKDEQSDLAGADSFFRDSRNPLASIASPRQIYTSKQAFEAEVNAKGMRPVNDYWLNVSNYCVKMLAEQAQYHLLNELKKIPLPNFEPYSDWFMKLVQENPISQDLKDRLKMVHSATDKEIQELSEHFTKARFTPAEIQQGLDDEKRGEPNRYLVDPQMILKEGGWIQAHENTGMVTFYRGSFQSAYVYRTLNDMLKTVFASKLQGKGFDTGGILGALQKVWMTLRQIKVSMAPIHYPQMVGNVISSAPISPIAKTALTAQIPYDIARSFFMAPGIGKGILQGTYAPVIGQTVEERARIRELIEAGSTNVGGYHMALQHLIGKADTTIFPQMTPALQRWWNLALAGGGTGPALLGEIQGHLSAKIQLLEIDQLVAKGWQEKDAIRYVVDKYNAMTYMTNEALWRGNFLRPALQFLTFSPDFATMPVRIVMAALQTPLGGAMYGAATGMAAAGPLGVVPGAAAGSQFGARSKFSYKTGGQSWSNIFTGAGINENLRMMQYGNLMKALFSTLVGYFMYLGLQQYGNYLWAKAQGKNPDPDTAYFWKNPYFGTFFNQQYDQDGKAEYLDWNRYRLILDFVSINAKLIEADYEKATGHKADMKFGAGLPAFVQNKFSLALDQYDYMRNINPMHPSEKLYDDTNDQGLKNWLITEGGSAVPINPWIGLSSVKDKYSENAFQDQLIKAATLVGQRVHLGTPNEGAVSEKQYQQWIQDVEHQQFVKKGGESALSVFQGGSNQPMNAKQRNLMNYFKRNRRAIETSEAETNPFDEINRIENPELSTTNSP